MAGLTWTCRTCGKGVPADSLTCVDCGRGMSESDMSRLGITGGPPAGLRLTQPSFSELSKRVKSFPRKAVLSFAAGTAVALMAVIVFYIRGC